MFIKGAAFAAEEITIEQLKAYKKGQYLSLGIQPENSTMAIVVKLMISAVDVKKHVIRIEGHAHHHGNRGNVTVLFYATPRNNGEEGYAELISYS